MPSALVDFVQSLSGPLTNHSRAIVRADWKRMSSKTPIAIENYFRKKYGIDLDGDSYEPDWYNA